MKKKYNPRNCIRSKIIGGLRVVEEFVDNGMKRCVFIYEVLSKKAVYKLSTSETRENEDKIFNEALQIAALMQ